ncbi:sensor histidine kinase [Clostridium tepidum]|nr:sensor histidine kinase [Clostridium tepidum]MCR1933987.1 sensor histidine kinase [Clostridium tepidum]
MISKETQVNESYFSFKTILLNHKDLVLAVIIKDITDIKEKEAQIVSKSVAIREIHHRVKNNLQTISSLLRLQSRRCESEEARVCLMESVSRILAIASTHELLSQEVSDNVNIIEVITLIINNIKRSFDNSSKTIDINVIGEEFQIDSDRATAISLIINELIQNSYDHGFKDKEKGHIYVIVKGNGEKIQMAVIDNGVGFTERETKSKSLGLTIVKSYVKDKLKGEIFINSSNRGTKVNIEFKM